MSAESDPFPRPEIDGREISRDDMFEHKQHGPMVVESFSHSPTSVGVTLAAEVPPDGPQVKLEYSEEQLRAAWGDTIHSDPEVVHGPRVTLSGIAETDDDPVVDITVEGEDPKAVELIAIHARAEAVEAMRAYREGSTPDEVEPHDVRVNWEDRVWEEADQ